MFLHIGGDRYIYKENIVAILDVKSVSNSKDTNRLIENMIKKGLLKNEITDNVKTYVITCEKKANKGMKSQHYLYISNISTSTLLRRNNRWK